MAHPFCTRISSFFLQSVHVLSFFLQHDCIQILSFSLQTIALSHFLYNTIKFFHAQAFSSLNCYAFELFHLLVIGCLSSFISLLHIQNFPLLKIYHISSFLRFIVLSFQFAPCICDATKIIISNCFHVISQLQSSFFVF